MMRTRAFIAALFVSAGTVAAGAQKPTTEFWPEVDVYYNEGVDARSMLEMAASSEREGTKREASVGLYEDWLRLPRGYLRGGFRYTFSTRDASYREPRIVTAATFTVYSALGMRLVNRLRPELRWVNGDFSYRLRERLHLQRYATDSTGWRWAPYGTFEGYYDSRYPGISKIGARAGTEVHLLGRIAFDFYVARQDNDATRPRYINALGITSTLTFKR